MSQAAAGSHSSRGATDDRTGASSRKDTSGGGTGVEGAVRSLAWPRRRIWLGIEWALLFAVLPTVVALKLVPMHVLTLLVIGGVFCVAVLLMDRSFERRQLWNVSGAARGVHRIVVTFIVLGVLMAVGVALMTPERLLHLVRDRPEVWLMIMLGYPIVSVYPQEVIFRTFMFHRYRGLFTDPRLMILASGLAFGYAHIFFENVIAVVMTIVGGLLFAWTYERTRSTFAVWLEHGLYGCFVFTIGLGVFFFSGAVGKV